MTRATRRHHNQRIKRNRRDYWNGGNSAKWLGMLVNTPKTCSCSMCNQKKQMLPKSHTEMRQQPI